MSRRNVRWLLAIMGLILASVSYVVVPRSWAFVAGFAIISIFGRPLLNNWLGIRRESDD